MASEHSELLRVLKREYEAENVAYKQHASEAERHRTIAVQMAALIRMLEAGVAPTAEQVKSVRNGHPQRIVIDSNVPLPPRGTFARKYERQPEFESVSTIEAIRMILSKNGPTHADDLAKRIYKFDPKDFQKVKSAIVSEIVKQVKAEKMKRTGGNTFALME